MSFVDKIIERYDLKPNSYDTVHSRNYQIKHDSLITKWTDRICDGWYGFDLCNAPESWFGIIDEFLLEIQKIHPTFKILQIKTKYGHLRIYLSLDESLDNDSNVYDYCEKLESVMFEKKIIY